MPRPEITGWEHLTRYPGSGKAYSDKAKPSSRRVQPAHELHVRKGRCFESSTSLPTPGGRRTSHKESDSAPPISKRQISSVAMWVHGRWARGQRDGGCGSEGGSVAITRYRPTGTSETMPKICYTVMRTILHPADLAYTVAQRAVEQEKHGTRPESMG